MGGPWRSRQFDPLAWQPPAPRLEVERQTAESRSRGDCLLGIAVAYVVSVLTSMAVMLALLKAGW